MIVLTLSLSVITDAISSFCTGLASLVSLIVTYVNDFMWWFDGTAGLLIAVYTLYSGVLTMINARVSEYSITD